MGVSFKEFALRNMFWLANALSFLVFSFLIPVLSTLFAGFPWVSNQRSQINGVGGDENPDDRNQLGEHIFRFDSGFQSLFEEDNSIGSQSVSNATTSKCEFVGGNTFCGYIEEPKDMSFKVQELFLDSSFEDGVTEESVVVVPRDVQELDDHVKTGDPVDQEGEEHGKLEGTDPSSAVDFPVVDDQDGSEVLLCTDPESRVDTDVGGVDDQMKVENSVANGSSLDKDSGEIDHKGTIEGSDRDEPSLDEDYKVEIKSSISISSHDEEALEGEVVNLADGVLSEPGAMEEALEEEELISRLDPDELDDQVESPREKNQLRFSFDHVSKEPNMLTNDFWHTNGKFIADFDDYYCYQSTTTEEVLAPETPMCFDRKSVDPYEEHVSGSDSTDSDHDDDDHQDSVMNHGEEEYWENPGELEMEETRNRVSEEDDEMDIDVLLEHQSYVQKMKKEMKHLRTTGLPTILEDSESPRMDEDLKPLKINQKVGYKDRLDEVQRFYKTYLDKMKRLDILCHQTMYAVGFLQLKNPGQLAANKKLSLPSIKSLLAHNLLPNKFRRHESDPVQKLIRDLQKDLELVYVGQLCLSWEILKWQHTKAEELQLYDTMGLHQYSLVAGEFQQFQVLVQRFTEDEPFQGPRVENYVKSRCANCSFLQVPPIKDDLKNNNEGKGDGKAVVLIVRLTDIIEESMHAFWEFIRTDKKEPSNVGVRDPLDAELLSNIRTNLAKKERRIKDLVKSGNCIVKKFQKHQDFRLTHELLLAQVELKLVGRVIGMSRLKADQLMWCHKKLGKISILGKKVHIESSFSLFPC